MLSVMGFVDRGDVIPARSRRRYDKWLNPSPAMKIFIRQRPLCTFQVRFNDILPGNRSHLFQKWVSAMVYRPRQFLLFLHPIATGTKLPPHGRSRYSDLFFFVVSETHAVWWAEYIKYRDVQVVAVFAIFSKRYYLIQLKLSAKSTNAD